MVMGLQEVEHAGTWREGINFVKSAITIYYHMPCCCLQNDGAQINGENQIQNRK